MRRIIGLASCLIILGAACGDDEEQAPPPVPTTPTPTNPPPGATPGGGEQGEGEAVPTTEQPPEGSSVQTMAPEPATGCPATDVTAQLGRAGTVHGSSSQGSETWDMAGSPHRFPRGFNVRENHTITVEPCTLVIVGEGRWIDVGSGGTLIASGEEGKPVRFDSGASQATPGAWRGVRLHGNARPATRFEHVIIEDAGGGDAAIQVGNELALDVRNVTIRHSQQHGVKVDGEGRFADTATNLVVTESGREDPYSAPVWFNSASQVRTLPEGEYTGNAADEIYVNREEVRSTGTWRNPGVPYRLNRGLRVGSQNGAVLTVAPGTTLAFNNEEEFWVGDGTDGAVVLDGESEETPIVLTSARPNPDAGDWQGLFLGGDRSNSAMKINHVVVSYAGGEPGRRFNVRQSCHEGDTGYAIGIAEEDAGPIITNTKVTHLPDDAVAILLGFRDADATDYTAAEHGNDFSEAGTTCTQNTTPEGRDCPDPACR